MGKVFVKHPGRPAEGRVIVNVGAVVIVLIEVDAIGEGPTVAEVAIVLQIQKTARVDGMGSGGVKDGPEGRGGNPLVARREQSVQYEPSPRDIGKELVKLLVVHVLRDAVVGGGSVQFLEEKAVVPVGI